MRTITRTCPRCGGRFTQPDDPGRKRVFCSGACRQADYRARTGKSGHEARSQARRSAREQAEQQARDQQEQREQRAREQARSRRQRARRDSYGTSSDWWSPRTTDTAAQAKARATCARLMERAEHSRTPEAEAQACREKADAIRAKKGL